MGGGPTFLCAPRFVGVASLGAAAATATEACPHIANCLGGSSRSLTLDCGDIVSNADKTLDMKKLPDSEEWDLCVDHGTAPLCDSQHLVFGPVPTAAEVEEAAEELQSAFLHLTIPVPPPELGAAWNPKDSTGCAFDLVEDTHNSSQKACYSDTRTLAVENCAAYEAFRVFQNPRVQDAVKSLARDPAVWKAVMTNQKVMELTHFLHEETDDSFSDQVVTITEGVQNATFENGTSETFMSKLTSLLNDFLTRVPLLEKLSEIIGSVFGSVGKASPRGVGGMDKTVASCIMLAVAVLVVVVMKRAV